MGTNKDPQAGLLPPPPTPVREEIVRMRANGSACPRPGLCKLRPLALTAVWWDGGLSGSPFMPSL